MTTHQSPQTAREIAEKATNDVLNLLSMQGSFVVPPDADTRDAITTRISLVAYEYAVQQDLIGLRRAETYLERVMRENKQEAP